MRALSIRNFLHAACCKAGDVTLQFGGAHLTEKPDDESFAQAEL